METTHPAPRVWSTVGYSDAFAHWREVVCQAFTKLSPERLNRDRFAGEIRLSDVGALGTLSEITAGPQTVERRRRDVAQRPCDAVFVNIQIAGGSIVRQRSIESHLTPGAFVMLDARQPFEMRFDRHFRQLCLHLPMALLDRHGFDPAPAIARAVKRDCVHGAAFMDSVGAVLDGVETEGDRDHLVELLRLCHAGGRSDMLADRHLKHIMRFIAHHCDDPDLTPTAVAVRHRISVRYLHKLFARSGVSFGRFLLGCRLRRARLAVLLHPHRPVIDIALDSGFRDASHFTRCFRRAFGMTPTAMRRRH